MFNNIINISRIAYIFFLLGSWLDYIFLNITTIVLLSLSTLLIIFVFIRKQELAKYKRNDLLLVLFLNITAIAGICARWLEI